jgi:hypothetical protein
MAGNDGDERAKDEIAGGMAESGKDQAKPGAGTRGQPGKGADPGKLTEGMSESGSGVPTGGEGEGNERGGTSG